MTTLEVLEDEKCLSGSDEIACQGNNSGKSSEKSDLIFGKNRRNINVFDILKRHFIVEKRLVKNGTKEDIELRYSMQFCFEGV